MKNLTMVVQYSSSQMVLQGLEEFKEKYGDFFTEISIFYVEDIETDVIPDDDFIGALDKADLVLIDVRSNRKTARILQEKLNNRTNVNVVVLLGAGLDLLKLTRLGDFHLGTYMNKFIKEKKEKKEVIDEQADDIEIFHEKDDKPGFDFSKIFKIKKIVKLMGTIFPFGGLKKSKMVFKIMDWWESGKINNFICILELIGSKFMGLKTSRWKKEKPKKYYKAAFWRPDSQDFNGPINKYLKKYPLDKDKRTLLIIFYGGYHFESSVIAVKRILEKYNDSWNIIPFYTDGVRTTKYFYKYINTDEAPFDAVLSLIWFPFNGGPGGGDLTVTHEILKQWDVPVFLGCGLYNQKYKDFLTRKEGLTPIQMLAAVIFPEMDGLIDCIPLLCNDSKKTKIGNQELNMIVPYAINDNIDLMIKRIQARIELKKLDNSEKKLVFILYNYPPGEAGIGNAAYFDSLLSIIKILEELEKQGYNIDYRKDVNILEASELKDFLIKNGFVNSPDWFNLKEKVAAFKSNPQKNKIELIKVKKEKYIDWFNSLYGRLKEKVIKEWGPPLGKLQVVDNQIYLPILKLGNIFIGIQPSRGDIKNLEKSYHDVELVPHHEYLCFYYYILNEINANAMVHIGTHGTLEFLPGKEAGLTKQFCYNFTMVDYIPHFYIYQISNTSEAMIAKRRSLATLISYQLPAFTESETDQNFTDLEEKLHLLREAKSLDNPNIEENERELLTLAKEKGITVSNIDELDHEILKCKTSLIPEGLHVFGEGYDIDEASGFLWNIQPMIPFRPNLFELLSDHYNLPKRAKEDLADYINEKKDEPLRRDIKQKGLKIIKYILLGKSINEIQNELLELDFLSDHKIVDLAEKIITFGKNSVKNREIEFLIGGLNGKYITPRMGGDPIRTPDVLPSGYNLFQFNPQLIPTDLAVKRGYEAAEQSIYLYKREHGEYPKNITMVLWGFETAKTHGESIGQIMAYLGIEISDLVSWRREPKLIPLSELGRPRINVTINICGFMRDLFSHVLEFIDESIDLVVDTDEPPDKNFVKAQYLGIKEDLLEEGVSEKEADFMGRVRIFGPDASEYGSNLPTMIESGAWKKPEQLGEMYLRQMRFAYRRNMRARPLLKIFKKQLKSTDMICQIRDTKAYAITDLDHYYEFVGGLSQASKVSGKKDLPPIYIVDTTSVKVETTSIKNAINRGIITRTANPKWIKGMLKHDYSGGKKVANNVNYLLGFAATTQEVEDSTWNQVYNTMVDNQEIQNLLKKNNKYAMHDLLGSLLESIRRDLWNATEEQEEKIKQLYLELEGLIEK
ncbi:MAG: cobaltochelatase subunit CobN [Promethearchaeota archaeon]|nr:MAG: cobaltochelatase subunit CobN [Candidatus Lokiarchaeota archaeon]